jgi:hypothetical protein
MTAMERLGACFAGLVVMTCLCVPLSAQTEANAVAKYVLDFSGSTWRCRRRDV